MLASSPRRWLAAVVLTTLPLAGLGTVLSAAHANQGDPAGTQVEAGKELPQLATTEALDALVARIVNAHVVREHNAAGGQDARHLAGDRHAHRPVENR